jgi:hypothetical protein
LKPAFGLPSTSSMTTARNVSAIFFYLFHRHSRGSGNPEQRADWAPAFTGTTKSNYRSGSRIET